MSKRAASPAEDGDSGGAPLTPKRARAEDIEKVLYQLDITIRRASLMPRVLVLMAEYDTLLGQKYAKVPAIRDSTDPSADKYLLEGFAKQGRLDVLYDQLGFNWISDHVYCYNDELCELYTNVAYWHTCEHLVGCIRAYDDTATKRVRPVEARLRMLENSKTTSEV